MSTYPPSPPPIEDPICDDEHSWDWYYETPGGGTKLWFGRYKGKPLYRVSSSYLEWCRRELLDSVRYITVLNGRPIANEKQRRLQQAIDIYVAGLLALAKDDYRDFIVPFGWTYRGSKIYQVRDKPWFLWTMTKPELVEKFPVFFQAVQHFVDNPRKYEVMRDIGALLDSSKYEDDYNRWREQEVDEYEEDGFVVSDSSEETGSSSDSEPEAKFTDEENSSATEDTNGDMDSDAVANNAPPSTSPRTGRWKRRISSPSSEEAEGDTSGVSSQEPQDQLTLTSEDDDGQNVSRTRSGTVFKKEDADSQDDETDDAVSVKDDASRDSSPCLGTTRSGRVFKETVTEESEWNADGASSLGDDGQSTLCSEGDDVRTGSRTRSGTLFKQAAMAEQESNAESTEDETDGAISVASEVSRLTKGAELPCQGKTRSGLVFKEIVTVSYNSRGVTDADLRDEMLMAVGTPTRGGNKSKKRPRFEDSTSDDESDRPQKRRGPLHAVQRSHPSTIKQTPQKLRRLSTMTVSKSLRRIESGTDSDTDDDLRSQVKAPEPERMRRRASSDSSLQDPSQLVEHLGLHSPTRLTHGGPSEHLSSIGIKENTALPTPPTSSPCKKSRRRKIRRIDSEPTSEEEPNAPGARSNSLTGCDKREASAEVVAVS